MPDQVLVWSETPVTLYVMYIRPIVFDFVIEQEVSKVQTGYPVPMGAHAQCWISWNFDARQYGLELVLVFNDDKQIIDVIKNIYGK